MTATWTETNANAQSVDVTRPDYYKPSPVVRGTPTGLFGDRYEGENYHDVLPAMHHAERFRSSNPPLSPCLHGASSQHLVVVTKTLSALVDKILLEMDI